MTAGEREQQKKDRAARRAICERCPNVGKGLIKTCQLCHCPIATKTLVPGSCPLKKW
jgi:hypothetical protein